MSIPRGIDLARAAGAGIHADVIEAMKDQLLIVLLRRLADKDGNIAIPVAEIDDTGMWTASFSVNNQIFNFVVSKKQ